MKLTLHGGFGEKGRTALAIETARTRIILDVGIHTGATGPGYYPALTPDQLSRSAAIIVTHAHEDHIGALGWCIAQGFCGRILMTAETRRAATAIWDGYAEPAHCALAEQAAIEGLAVGQRIEIGDLAVETGRSGHIVGGVWCRVSHGTTSVGYCGDLVPSSPVFACDPLPGCDALVIDASYGDDAVSYAERATAIRSWIAGHEAPILPMPLEGKPLELLAIVERSVAIHVTMRHPLAAQIDAAPWLHPGMAARLSARLATALDWQSDEPLPNRPLLCFDGMGMTGPSRSALERARAEHRAVLLTGHLPANSPAQQMHQAGLADWIRLPTHPTLCDTRALVERCAPRLLIGHSAEPDHLLALARQLPQLRSDLRTGDTVEIAA